MKVLQVVEQALRATAEEQDDTILWLSRAMRNAGADIRILLAGNAVYYALAQRVAPALQLGEWIQRHPADIGSDVRQLLADGVEIKVVEEDLAERGLHQKQCTQGVNRIKREDLAALYNSVDQVWQW